MSGSSSDARAEIDTLSRRELTESEMDSRAEELGIFSARAHRECQQWGLCATVRVTPLGLGDSNLPLT